MGRKKNGIWGYELDSNETK